MQLEQQVGGMFHVKTPLKRIAYLAMTQPEVMLMAIQEKSFNLLKSCHPFSSLLFVTVRAMKISE